MKKIKTPKEEALLSGNNVLMLRLTSNEENSGAFAIQSKQELKKVIQGITSSQIKSKNFYVHFVANEKARKWFKELYKKEFYKINNEQNIITLRALPNGIRRTKQYKKTLTSQKTLENSLKRIKKSIGEKLGELDFAVDIENIFYNSPNNNNTINIIIEDLRELKKENGSCLILFNTVSWEYNIISIISERNLKEIEKIIRWGFERHTSSTRAYRKKMFAHED